MLLGYEMHNTTQCNTIHTLHLPDQHKDHGKAGTGPAREFGKLITKLTQQLFFILVIQPVVQGRGHQLIDATFVTDGVVSQSIHQFSG